MIINPYSFGVAYDPDAQAFFTASGLTGATNLTAINQLVVDLKTYGIWTKMKAIYPIIGGTAALHKWNLKDPRDLDAAFRLVFSGGMTHSSTGIAFGGVNGYGNTYLDTQNNLSLNSGSLSYYSRTNAVTASIRIDIGSLRAGVDSYSDIVTSATNLTYSRFNNSATFDNISSTTTLGFFLGSRTASNIIRTFRNGVQIISGTAPSNSTSPIDFYIGAANSNNSPIYYSNRQCAFASIGDGLSVTEALVFNQIVEGYQYALYRNVNPVNQNYYNTSYQNETNTFLYASEITDNTQKNAINTLVSDLKTAGIWTKMRAVYPFVGGTASTHKWNLINPQDTDAAFRLTFTGGWTHSSTGALPNGTNAYANTFLSPSTSLTNNNTHMSYYSRTNTQGANKGLIGASVGGSFIPLYTIYGRSGSNVFFMDSYNYNTNRNQQAEPTGQSFLLSTRISNTSFKSFRNNSLVATGVNANADNVTNINFPISIGGLNLGGSVSQFSDFQCAFSSIGDGLTDAEAGNLYTAVQAFNTALARNI
jgi:hypothetical protein